MMGNLVEMPEALSISSLFSVTSSLQRREEGLLVLTSGEFPSGQI
jgi:hypothetical protein